MSISIRKLTLPTDITARVTAMFQHYGRGKRSAYAGHIYSRALADQQRDGAYDKRTAWTIYNRLCDFGLIGQTGSLVDLSWQWIGDRVFVTNSGQVVLPCSCITQEPYRNLLDSGLFRKSTVFEQHMGSELTIKLSFFVVDSSSDTTSLLNSAESSISVTYPANTLDFLPSAADIRNRLSQGVDQLPDLDGSEVRPYNVDRWLPMSAENTAETHLLRKPREHLPGYQQWLIDVAKKESFELANSEWASLILWWVGQRRWPISYEKGRSRLCVPTRLFLMLPSLIRYSLISRTQRWPKTISAAGIDYFEFLEVGAADVRTLIRLYAPAIEVMLEQ